MKVLISGISSPLGFYTAKLLKERGSAVLGFSRNLPTNKIEGISYCRSDIRLSDLHKLSIGCDVIVHIAALSSPWGRRRDFFEINAEGTKRLLEAAWANGCSRFIYISTPALYFAYKDGFSLDESQIASKPVNFYCASKALAESYVSAYHNKGLETLILRPKALFGPGDTVLVPRLLKALANGGIPRFTKRDVMVDLTYVENVAEAILLAIDTPAKYSGSIYNITNDEPYPLHQVIQNLLSAMGLPYKEKKIPYPVARSLAYLLEIVSIFYPKEPLFTQYAVGALTFSQTLSINKAKTELGYAPKISIEEGINRYAKWWKTHANHSY
jgi:nucleoside-diphosphate-sugar epimerase